MVVVLSRPLMPEGSLTDTKERSNIEVDLSFVSVNDPLRRAAAERATESLPRAPVQCHSAYFDLGGLIQRRPRQAARPAAARRWLAALNKPLEVGAVRPHSSDRREYCQFEVTFAVGARMAHGLRAPKHRRRQAEPHLSDAPGRLAPEIS
ncbi:hypothetical protein J2S43_008407 [Catenuloplanes nepalensis]|uniref:Uncharacterized protein n=1 Tax=Catenuloplanes nepalensis TaxID=587533 RepID=A0ABT9N873_9ACTN|nr:hypothetical protein [Catenuloplanes nepalensis]MDP9799895.1 hypothetical protein [Catenuloplanes nepalensis]